LFFLHEEFNEYEEKAKTLPDSTTNESKLCRYGLFKQATVGPVNTGLCTCLCLLLLDMSDAYAALLLCPVS
jgi:acyl-CoA-binding protein